MNKYEVEVEGHYCAVIEVEASSHEEAENEAIGVFEGEFDVVYSMGADSWDHTSIVASELVE